MAYHVERVAPEVAIAFVLFKMPEHGELAGKIDSWAIGEQLAERHTADIGVRITALAEITVVDFADDIAVQPGSHN